jgi:hypothetical protein
MHGYLAMTRTEFRLFRREPFSVIFVLAFPPPGPLELRQRIRLDPARDHTDEVLLQGGLLQDWRGGRRHPGRRRPRPDYFVLYWLGGEPGGGGTGYSYLDTTGPPGRERRLRSLAGLWVVVFARNAGRRGPEVYQKQCVAPPSRRAAQGAVPGVRGLALLRSASWAGGPAAPLGTGMIRGGLVRDAEDR